MPHAPRMGHTDGVSRHGLVALRATPPGDVDDYWISQVRSVWAVALWRALSLAWTPVVGRV